MNKSLWPATDLNPNCQSDAVDAWTISPADALYTMARLEVGPMAIVRGPRGWLLARSVICQEREPNPSAIQSCLIR